MRRSAVGRQDGAGRSSSWVGDGSRLIIESERDGNWEIYSIDVDGSNPVRLTSNSADDRFPEWRP